MPSDPNFIQISGSMPRPIVPGIIRRTVNGERLILKRVGDAWTAQLDTPVGVGRTPDEALANLQSLRGAPTEDQKMLRAMGIA